MLQAKEFKALRPGDIIISKSGYSGEVIDNKITTCTHSGSKDWLVYIDWGKESFWYCYRWGWIRFLDGAYDPELNRFYVRVRKKTEVA